MKIRKMLCSNEKQKEERERKKIKKLLNKGKSKIHCTNCGRGKKKTKVRQ